MKLGNSWLCLEPNGMAWDAFVEIKKFVFKFLEHPLLFPSHEGRQAVMSFKCQGRAGVCAANFLNLFKKDSAESDNGLAGAYKVTTSRMTWGLVKGLAAMPCIPALARL